MTTNDPAAEAAGKEVVLERVIDAPREMVFKAWTDEEQMARWWGPHGFTNPVCQLDVRPGGAIRIDMTDADGAVYPMTGEFKEIVSPERLVFSAFAFDGQSDEPGLEALTTVTFADLGGKTKLTVKSVVVNVRVEFLEALAGMEEGWSQSLERLEALLGAG